MGIMQARSHGFSFWGTLRVFWALARQTTLEVLRQPLALLTVTVCVMGIALMPLLITHTLGEAQRMVRDSALALQFLCGLVLGAYAAGATVHRELRRGGAALALTKPIDPALFFLAKFVGVAMVLLLFALACLAASLPAIRAAARDYHMDWWAELPLLLAAPLAFGGAAFRNYRTGRSFSAGAFAALLGMLVAACLFTACTTAHGWAGAPSLTRLPMASVPVSGLIALATMMLAAIACALATRLPPAPTLTICATIFLLGLMSDYLFGRYAAEHTLAAVLYAVIPNLQHFWLTDALHQGRTIPLPYYMNALAYAMLYSAGVLTLGWLSFRCTEVDT